MMVNDRVPNDSDIEPTSTDMTHAQVSKQQRFSQSWAALLGGQKVQVTFPDTELNARVYTLDGDSGYRVQQKKVRLADHGRESKPELAEDCQRLTYPKKARRGENHGRARLELDDIIAIRAWADDLKKQGATPPWTQKAAELNVSEGTLRDIVARRTWSHV